MASSSSKLVEAEDAEMDAAHPTLDPIGDIYRRTFKLKRLNTQTNKVTNHRRKEAGWTIVTQLQITIILMILAISVTALAIALLPLFGGTVYFDIHLENRISLCRIIIFHADVGIFV